MAQLQEQVLTTEVLKSFFARRSLKKTCYLFLLVPEYEGEILEDNEFIQEEVLKRLRELDPGKFSDPDNIYLAILKELATHFRKFLAFFSVSHWTGLISRHMEAGKCYANI